MEKIIEKIIKFLKKNAVIIILTAVLIITALLAMRQCSHNKQINKMHEAISDTLKTYKNKYNQEVARIGIIQAERNKDFLKLKSQDSTVIALQDLVQEYKKKIKQGGTATIIEVETLVHDTTLVYYTDSAIFFSDYNEWLELNGEIRDNVLDYHLIVNNKFKMVTGKEKGKPFTEFISENPYTHTNVLRVYQNTGKKKHFVLTTGLGVIGGADLFTGKPALTGGVFLGLGWKILDF